MPLPLPAMTELIGAGVDRILGGVNSEIRNLLLNEESYAVGGAVRDVLLGREPVVDVDFVVRDAESFVSVIRRKVRVSVVTLDDEFGVFRIVDRSSDRYIDVTRMQGASIEDDLGRRDFSMNAVAVRVDGVHSVIDPFAGMDDIAAGRIRALSSANIMDDPLRILRGYRFAAETGFVMEPRTREIFRDLAALAGTPSAERIKGEIYKILRTPAATAVFSQMIDDGVLERLMPFVGKFKGYAAGARHRFDLLNHSIETMRIVETFAGSEFPFETAPGLLECELDQDAPVRALLKLAAFVHDAGKPLTLNTSGGKNTFYRHEIEGGTFVAELLKSCKMANDAVRFVSILVRYHMYPFHLMQASSDKTSMSARSYLRLKRDVGEYVPLLFALFIADTAATADDESSHRIIESARTLFSQYVEYDRKNHGKKPFLSGNEIMSVLGIGPGPALGVIIERLREAEVGGEVTSRDQAVAYVQRINDGSLGERNAD